MSSISVVICAYTLDRWSEMLAAVKSVQNQTLSPGEIILVIDHNQTLFERAYEQLKDVVVVENSEGRGLSGARNTGIACARGELVAFMDEDATARPDWLERLVPAYQDHDVLGAGGAIEPVWIAGRPDWFPEEFDWVVGCTYRGMPIVSSPVRNLIGCNMSFRREVFEVVGGFREGIGRVGNVPLGCEETELCIRARQSWPQGRFVYEPRARVSHRVPSQRGALAYFHSRCSAEGLSKALVASFVGSREGLDTERSYVLHTLPRGVLRGMGEAFFHRRPAGLGRATAIVAGLAWTVGGYIKGKASLSLKGGLEAKYPKAAPYVKSAPIGEDVYL